MSCCKSVAISHSYKYKSTGYIHYLCRIQKRSTIRCSMQCQLLQNINIFTAKHGHAKYYKQIQQHYLHTRQHFLMHERLTPRIQQIGNFYTIWELHATETSHNKQVYMYRFVHVMQNSPNLAPVSKSFTITEFLAELIVQQVRTCLHVCVLA